MAGNVSPDPESRIVCISRRPLEVVPAGRVDGVPMSRRSNRRDHEGKRKEA